MFKNNTKNIIALLILSVLGLISVYNSKELKKELEYKENWIYNQELQIESLKEDIEFLEFKISVRRTCSLDMFDCYSEEDLERVKDIIMNDWIPDDYDLAYYDLNDDNEITITDYTMLKNKLNE